MSKINNVFDKLHLYKIYIDDGGLEFYITVTS